MTIVDNRTPNRSYTEPYALNDLADDVARLVAAIRGIDTDMAAVLTSLGGKADTGHHHPIEEIDGLQSALDGKADFNHSHTLNDLSDVDVSAASDGMFLKRVAGQWVASVISLGDFGYLAKDQNLADLTDIKVARQNIGLYRRLTVANADTNLSAGNASVTEVLYTATWTANRTITLPLANTRNRGDAVVFRDPNNYIGSRTVTWQAQGTDTLVGTPSFNAPEREVRLVSDGVSQWTIDNTKAVQQSAAACYFTPWGPNSGYWLYPENGNTIPINGRLERIPAGGVPLPNSPAIDPNVLTYIYAYMNAGQMALLISTTAFAIDPYSGIPMMTGNRAYTLVGMFYQYQGISWFNRKQKYMSSYQTNLWLAAPYPVFQFGFPCWNDTTVDVDLDVSYHTKFTGYDSYLGFAFSAPGLWAEWQFNDFRVPPYQGINDADMVHHSASRTYRNTTGDGQRTITLDVQPFESGSGGTYTAVGAISMVVKFWG